MDLPLKVYSRKLYSVGEWRRDTLLQALEAKSSLVEDINTAFRNAKMETEILAFYSASCDLRSRVVSIDTIPKKMHLIGRRDPTAPTKSGIKFEDEMPLRSRYLKMKQFSGETDPRYKAMVHSVMMATTRRPAFKGTNADLTQTYIWPMNLCG